MLADYAQLEGAWIGAGGSAAMAPVMAAIAMAESGERVGGVWMANTDALNPNDNGGRQSSYGAWQISNGTHLPPSGDWNSLDGNAQLAVAKYNSQGLGAWGTYTSGAYKQFVKGGVPPSGGTQTAQLDSFWGGISNFFGNTLGNVTGINQLTHDVQGGIRSAEDLVLRGAKILAGAGLVVVGTVLLFKDSKTVQVVTNQATGAASGAAGATASAGSARLPVAE